MNAGTGTDIARHHSFRLERGPTETSIFFKLQTGNLPRSLATFSTLLSAKEYSRDRGQKSISEIDPKMEKTKDIRTPY